MVDSKDAQPYAWDHVAPVLYDYLRCDSDAIFDSAAQSRSGRRCARHTISSRSIAGIFVSERR